MDVDLFVLQRGKPGKLQEAITNRRLYSHCLNELGIAIIEQFLLVPFKPVLESFERLGCLLGIAPLLFSVLLASSQVLSALSPCIL
jgi:hypothetical protein